MACASCRESMARCRDLYFSIEKSIPRLNGAEGDPLLENLEGVIETGRLVANPYQRTLVQSLAIFVQRRDVQVALVLLAVIGWKILAG
jgi:hypothetical protein